MFDEEIYLFSHCGTFALALHDLMEGKVKLSMLIGSRFNQWEEEERVNIHCFIRHPMNDSLGIDVTGVFSISRWEETWLFNEKSYNPSSKEPRVELVDLSREEFIQQLSLTGSPDPHGLSYEEAKEYIIDHQVLELFN